LTVEEASLPTLEVLKAQELVYELRIGEIMSRGLVTVSPDTSMREVKNLLRDRRISGLPVIEEDALAGIVTIEDLIRSMDAGDLDVPVRQYMTAQVYTVQDHDSVEQALKKFAQTRVGRLPVVDEAGKPVGIITPDDITRGVLKALQTAYHEDEIRRYRASHIFEDIASDKTSLVLRYNVALRDFHRAGRASSQLKQTLNRLGIHPRIVRRVAIASYEAEMNIVIHSSTGGTLVAEVTPNAISVLAADQGPGIADLQQAIQPGFSTAPDWIREMGFGAGMGLSNIKSVADDMHITSLPGEGTKLTIVIYLQPLEGEGKTG
jgi:CBS domain-containing protein/anti-sigma regulatory factor (Ser/Thr protein kinase)